VLDNLTSNLQTQLVLEIAVGNLKLLFVLGFVLGKWGYDVLRRINFYLFFIHILRYSNETIHAILQWIHPTSTSVFMPVT
jgi:hypothetical protein